VFVSRDNSGYIGSARFIRWGWVRGIHDIINVKINQKLWQFILCEVTGNSIFEWQGL
jgi:hypothetical protein